VYNNALLERDLGSSERLDAVDLMEAAYASAGVTFAARVHESDVAMRDELEARGYTLNTWDPCDGHGAQRHPPPAAGDRARLGRLVGLRPHLEALEVPPGLLGTDRPDLIPGRVSHGFIRRRNADILRLARLMPVGTPITIT
jgi:hypothetical protein